MISHKSVLDKDLSTFQNFNTFVFFRREFSSPKNVETNTMRKTTEFWETNLKIRGAHWKRTQKKKKLMQIAGKLQLKAQIEPNPIKVRVLFHIDQVFLGCAIYKS